MPAGEIAFHSAVDVEQIAIAVQQRFSGDQRAVAVKVTDAVGEPVEAGGGVALLGKGQRGVRIDVQRVAAITASVRSSFVKSFVRESEEADSSTSITIGRSTL